MEDSDEVVFDVRGKIFSTTLHILNRYPDSLLPAMCTEPPGYVGTGRNIRIDRDPEKFGWILEIYRSSGKQSLPSGWRLDDIKEELDFYGLPSVTELFTFHCKMWVGMEKLALKKLADKLCMELGRVGENLILTSFARFLVWTERNNRTNLQAVYIDNTIPSDIPREIKSFLSTFSGFEDIANWGLQETWYLDGCFKKDIQGRWTSGSCEILSLTGRHVSMLSQIMASEGFNVELDSARAFTDLDVSLLRVTFR